jgi:AraC family transcriptional regulator
MRDTPHIDLRFRKPKSDMEAKRTFSCEMFSVERVRIVDADPYDYSYRGGSDYLALHDIVRNDGESFVDGAAREHVKDIRNKLTFIPADCTVSGWTAPTRRLNSFLAIYFAPEAMAQQVEENGLHKNFAPAMYFEDTALLSTLSKIDMLLRQQSAPDKLYVEILGLVAAIEMYHLQAAE